eukprot:765456-Hanusia_phi.AAC.12
MGRVEIAVNQVQVYRFPAFAPLAAQLRLEAFEGASSGPPQHTGPRGPPGAAAAPNFCDPGCP